METNRLEQAIHSAVAATTAPDDARLADILARLQQAPVPRRASRRSVWPWLLLAAAGAAAAGVGGWYVSRLPDSSAPTPVASPPLTPDSTHREDKTNASGTVQDDSGTAPSVNRDSGTMIYRRQD
jgi:hypothetical protein